MSELNDHELLSEYARSQSEPAFAALVNRYLPLIYSVGLRFTGNPHHAEEITQAVFIVLARKAGRLRPGTVLSGWLYQTARLTAANFRKGEWRRQRREQEAYMQSALNEPDARAWEEIAPLLDEAMGRLGETDRNAVVLRFFENKTAREVGVALNLSEAAAHQRVKRALEKLRKIFAKRGVALPVAVLAGALSANAVHAAPARLVAAVTAAVSGGAALAASTASLAQATLKAIAWAQYKYAVGVGAAVLVGGTALVMTVTPRYSSSPPPPSPAPPSPAAVEAEAPTAEPREPFTETMKLNLDSPVGGLAIRPDGGILLGTTLGGFFINEQSGMLGYYSRGAMCLKPDGTLDRSFFCDVGRPGVVDAMRARVGCLADGRVFICGFFDAVDGKPRPSYSLLLPDGRVDESFEPWRGGTNVPGREWYPEGIHPAALLNDGWVAVVTRAVQAKGNFPPTTVYRFDATGRTIPPATNVLAGEFSSPSGLVLTLGPVGFWARKSVDWSRDTPAARRPPFKAGPPSDLPHGWVGDLPFERWNEPPSAADAAKVLAALFEEVPLEICRYAVRLPDGGAILAVCDRFIDGALHRPGRFMRFDRNWKPDPTFSSQFDVHIQGSLTLKMQPDGKLLVAGLGTLNGEKLRGLARLTADGALDRTFHCETGDSLMDRVMDIAFQPDGRIVIGGFFSKVNGTDCPHIARLLSDGSLDPTFRTPFLTLDQFNRERFKHRRVPVQQIARAGSSPDLSSPAAGDSGGRTPAGMAPQTVLITALNMQRDTAAIHFTGNPGQVYILQARDRLNTGKWSNVATNQAGADSAGVFRDTDAGNHATRFYRVATASP